MGFIVFFRFLVQRLLQLRLRAIRVFRRPLVLMPAPFLDQRRVRQRVDLLQLDDADMG